MSGDFHQRLRRIVEQYLAEIATPAEYLSLLRWQMAEGHALHERTTMPGHLTTSAIVLSPDHRQTLLIDHIVIGRWLQPGGHYEDATSFHQSAEREAVEETGVSGLRLHSWHRDDLPFVIESHDVPGKAARGERPHIHHDLQYLFVADPALPLVAQADEVHGVRWAPISALADFAPKATARLTTVSLPIF